MAAGFVTLTILDGLGNQRVGDFYSLDGTITGTLIPPSIIVDATGTPIDYTAASSVVGPVAAGSAVGSSAPLQMSFRSASTNPTAVSDGQVVRAMADLKGRLVNTPFQVRELCGDAFATVTSSTAATTLLAAQGAGVIADLTSITLVNTGTATVVQILNADGTTVRWTGYAPAGDMRGIVFPTPLKGAAANAIWQIKTLTSTNALTATVTYALNT